MNTWGNADCAFCSSSCSPISRTSNYRMSPSFVDNISRSPYFPRRIPFVSPSAESIKALQHQVQQLKDENNNLRGQINNNTKAISDILSSASSRMMSDSPANRNDGRFFSSSDELEALKRKNDEIEIENKVLNSQIQRLFISASDYFDENVNSMDSLLRMFRNTPKSERKPPRKENEKGSTSSQIIRYQKKLQSLENRLAQAQKSNFPMIEDNEYAINEIPDKKQQKHIESNSGSSSSDDNDIQMSEEKSHEENEDSIQNSGPNSELPTDLPPNPIEQQSINLDKMHPEDLQQDQTGKNTSVQSTPEKKEDASNKSSSAQSTPEQNDHKSNKSSSIKEDIDKVSDENNSSTPFEQNQNINEIIESSEKDSNKENSQETLEEDKEYSKSQEEQETTENINQIVQNSSQEIHELSQLEYSDQHSKDSSLLAEHESQKNEDHSSSSTKEKKESNSSSGTNQESNPSIENHSNNSYYCEESDHSQKKLYYYERDSSALNSTKGSQNLFSNSCSDSRSNLSQISVNQNKIEIGNLNIFEKTADDNEIVKSSDASDLETLKVVHEETVKEMQTLRKAFFQKNDSSINDEIKKYKETILQFQDENMNLKQKIENMKTKKQMARVEIKSSKETISILEERIEELNKHFDEVNEEIESMRNRFQEEKDEEKKNEEIPIPAIVFDCKKFDQELKSKVQAIASNQSYSNFIKIQSVLNTVCLFFLNKIDEKDKKNQADKQLYQTAQKALEDKLNAIEMEKIPELNRLLKDTAQKLIDANKEIVCMKQEETNERAKTASRIKKERRENKKLLKLISELQNENETFKVKTESLKQEIMLKDTVITQIDDKKEALLQELNEYNQSNQELVRKLQVLQDANQVLSEEKVTMIEKLKKAKAKKLSRLEEYKVEKANMQMQIDQIKAEQDETMQQKQTQNIQQSKLKDDQISDLKNIIEKNRNDFEEKEKKYIQKIKTLEDQLAQQKNQNTKFADFKKQIEEKQKTIDSYKNTIATMQNQCKGHRSDLKKVAKELIKERKLRSELEQSKQDAEILIQKHDLENQRLKDKVDKLTKQNDDLIKSQNSIQSQMTGKVAMINKQYQTELYNLTKYISNAFTEGHVSHDPKGARRILEDIHSELVKLREADRKIRMIARIDDNISTADGIAFRLLQS